MGDRTTYDNRAEFGFAAIRDRRVRRIGSVTVLLVGILVLMWFVFGAPSLASGDSTGVTLWVASSAYPALLLIFGWALEFSGPLNIRVEGDAIWTSRLRKLPLTRLAGSVVEETPRSIGLRRPPPQAKRLWFLIPKQNLADPEAFRVAVARAMERSGSR